jgi:hypothetical protein
MLEEYSDKLPELYLNDMADKSKQIKTLFRNCACSRCTAKNVNSDRPAGAEPCNDGMSLGEMRQMYLVWCDNYVEFYKDAGPDFVISKDFTPKYVFNIINSFHKKLNKFLSDVANEVATEVSIADKDLAK